MRSYRRNSFYAILASVFAVLICCSADLKADWVLVQNSPIRMYRDTRTNMEWSVTIASSGNSHSKAKGIVQKYGLRLPTWSELRDVVNNNDGIDYLEIEDGFLDLYETDQASVMAGAFGGSIDTKRPRNPLCRTWVIGVRD